MPTDHSRTPPLLARLVDDARAMTPGSVRLAEAVAAHAGHRSAWYADLVGPLLVPASALAGMAGVARTNLTAIDGPVPRIGVVGDTGLGGIPAAFEAAAASDRWVQYEIAVAKRGEDPQPGLRTLLAEAAMGPAHLDVYAEVPLTWGLLDALDTLAAERVTGTRVAAKFRTGGLAAELFPTPVELAAVICACRERGLPFKLTAGLHRALRYADPETGLTHHGFLNVLAAVLTAGDGAEVAEVAELLGTVDPLPVIEVVRPRLSENRPLWISYGSADVDEALADLTMLDLLHDA